MPEAIRVERNGPIGTVILHRPAVRNAVDPPAAAALAQACLSLDRDPEIRVLVLWGEGGTFCAGADLGSVSRGWNSSCRAQWDHGRAEALRTEFARGLDVLDSSESARGAARFMGGAGRGGQPVD